MKVIVKEIAWIKVERHLTHQVDIDSDLYAEITQGLHPEYKNIKDWAYATPFGSADSTHSDVDQHWEDSEIESVTVA
jgi:hypothetical protein